MFPNNLLSTNPVAHTHLSGSSNMPPVPDRPCPPPDDEDGWGGELFAAITLFALRDAATSRLMREQTTNGKG